MTQNNPRDAYRDELTHVDESGDVRMVDVGDKAVTRRIAVAEGSILMHPETQAMVLEDRAKKGDVLACARVARIMASKRTSDLIPMCHPLNITKSKVEIESIPAMGEGARKDGRVGFHVLATCGVTGVTGIEMEALTAASTACLTIYDMCKAVDRGMEIVDVRLLLKEGGRSGVWEREGASAAAVEGKDGADAAASDSSEDAPAAPAPAVAFIGYQNSGKTTLVEKVIAELTARGLRVGSIKHHGHHRFDIDVPGKDSWRHAEAGSRHVGLICAQSIRGYADTDQGFRLMACWRVTPMWTWSLWRVQDRGAAKRGGGSFRRRSPARLELAGFSGRCDAGDCLQRHPGKPYPHQSAGLPTLTMRRRSPTWWKVIWSAKGSPASAHAGWVRARQTL